jgi:hypothetical protein
MRYNGAVYKEVIMEITDRVKETLLEFQQCVSDIKGQIRELNAELQELEEAYLDAYPVKVGDRILYHDREWIVLKVEIRYRLPQDIPCGLIHLVKPTRNGGIPKNRVDGDEHIGLHQIGEPAPVYGTFKGEIEL